MVTLQMGDLELRDSLQQAHTGHSSKLLHFTLDLQPGHHLKDQDLTTAQALTLSASDVCTVYTDAGNQVDRVFGSWQA